MRIIWKFQFAPVKHSKTNWLLFWVTQFTQTKSPQHVTLVFGLMLLNYKTHNDKVAQEGSKRVSLFKILSNNWKIERHTPLKTYQQWLRPVLEYASQSFQWLITQCWKVLKKSNTNPSSLVWVSRDPFMVQLSKWKQTFFFWWKVLIWQLCFRNSRNKQSETNNFIYSIPKLIQNAEKRNPQLQNFRSHDKQKPLFSHKLKRSQKQFTFGRIYKFSRFLNITSWYQCGESLSPENTDSLKKSRTFTSNLSKKKMTKFWLVNWKDNKTDETSDYTKDVIKNYIENLSANGQLIFIYGSALPTPMGGVGHGGCKLNNSAKIILVWSIEINTIGDSILTELLSIHLLWGLCSLTFRKQRQQRINVLTDWVKKAIKMIKNHLHSTSMPISQIDSSSQNSSKLQNFWDLLVSR